VPPRRFDTVFFAFWLSHVPASAFGRFWSVVRSALASDGRVLFVDDLPDAADREAYLAGSGEIVERRLQDGTRHRLVKLVRDQQTLTRQLTELGWHAAVTRSGPDWPRPSLPYRAVSKLQYLGMRQQVRPVPVVGQRRPAEHITQCRHVGGHRVADQDPRHPLSFPPGRGTGWPYGYRCGRHPNPPAPATGPTRGTEGAGHDRDLGPALGPRRDRQRQCRY